MTTTTKAYFATVSSDADSWGCDLDGFDHIAEARRIRDAADAAGIPVAFDSSARHLRQNEDGTENYEIDWFSAWCSDGHKWTDEQWTEWFTRYAK
jgi:hypothetical protein